MYKCHGGDHSKWSNLAANWRFHTDNRQTCVLSSGKNTHTHNTSNLNIFTLSLPMSVIFVNIKTCPWPWTMTVWGHKPSQGDEGPAQQLGFLCPRDDDHGESTRKSFPKTCHVFMCQVGASWDKPNMSFIMLNMLRNCTLLILTTSTGWWFGTYFCIFPYIGNNFTIVLLPHTLGTITPTDFHIFQRGSDH